ncbi:fibronectin/fibrinogen-binding protein [Apilactobacillus timberlakei]|uniref:NFACT RNA binding domain-containing protein n=1 Tax=Apilactobacillus timberlakei TaxID=2008380 RepID=UPI00112BC151|nr:NFACT RNA binding domain-containing protein [Apilactobacillus timberlakei]TPR20153.1 fibronectin/fibrinogen-binding protein [Apilactobacillus timberlakei]TPR21871.1 fibronectin/fibrinogen-binding protein [Apilactobacillus timberlakei]TPR22272.1 fibronectin/fibrinogen-binding protein [Apilactobacillus timberlakei]TPR24045.1 fibronectin/fibrinogen-binding protein [Apilactobacillus timberlakei]
MSFDGSFTHAMTKELNKTLSNGRVSKINQPYDNEVIMAIRANHKNYPLLMSANPNYARVQVTNVPYNNPSVPTNFTMTLRKHLNGSILSKVSQVDNDRVIRFHFITRNEIGDLKEMLLIVEIMARHSNVILVDKQDDMRIIDAVKRIGADKNRYRTLLPGDQYITPPKQNMFNPFEASDSNISSIQELESKYPNQEMLASNIQHITQGLGKDTSLYLANYLHQDGNVKTLFNRFFEKFNQPVPTLLFNENNKEGFSVYPFINNSKNIQFSSLSELLDKYYASRAQKDRVKEQGGTLIHIAKNELKKNRNKKKKLQKTLDNTKKADEYRIKGEILTTYLYKIERGMKSIELPNFYDENKLVKINLSNQLSPSENAQKYFKRYQKSKNAVIYVNEQLKKTNEEIEYFENVLSQIELANPADLTDIKTEFKEEGYLKKNHNSNASKKNKRQKISKPEVFTSDNGIQILVGKNNLQNDKLTLKDADKRDIWLHTQKIHGSHVIIKSFDPDEKTIQQAAELAAYFSKARDSATVPVDYVKVKHVRKPNGAKPGLVIYEGQKTAFVTPREKDVKHLRANNK